MFSPMVPTFERKGKERRGKEGSTIRDWLKGIG